MVLGFPLYNIDCLLLHLNYFVLGENLHFVELILCMTFEMMPSLILRQEKINVLLGKDLLRKDLVLLIVNGTKGQ